MILQERISLLKQLSVYILSSNNDWEATKERASIENPWFTPNFIETSTQNIAHQFLQEHILYNFASLYNIPADNVAPKNIGVIMAGNIPLVGFHDFLCVFISGNKITIKPSSKDEVLIKHLVEKLITWNPEVQNFVNFAERLLDCDAYIATGSNNSSKYFEHYFSKWPNIIRKNRTSVAVIDGNETKEELELLADDIQMYFGLGCRNVTQLFVPSEYDFIPLLQALKKYEVYADLNKYKNNFDYYLAMLIMGNKFYMSNESVILTENESLFSPISQVHYQFYSNSELLLIELNSNKNIQCIVGNNLTPFGNAQQPTITDFADGVDTMKFLMEL